MMLISFFLACLPEMSSMLSANIFDSTGEIIANSSIQIRAADGSLLDEIETTDGSFSASLPVYSHFFLVISADNYETSSFSGYSGEGDFSAAQGTLWLRTTEEVNTIRDEFSDCNTEGSVIDGEVRLGIAGSSVLDLPVVTSATISAFDAEDTETTSCYLSTIDPETNEESIGFETGDTGRFATFGLSEGLHNLIVTVAYDENTTKEYDFPVFVPVQGNIPLYPILIPFMEE